MNYKKFLIPILFIYILNIQKICSFELNNFYTYENITKYENAGYYIYFHNENQILKKSEILKIKNEYHLSYFCKNDICTKVNRNCFEYFVEIPDENNNKKLYISETYRYDEIKSLKHEFLLSSKIKCNSTTELINNEDCYINVYTSFKCTSNSQCLSNKCVDGACIYNEENPIEFCTSIYHSIFFFYGFSYMNCGKAISEPCHSNKECATKTCTKHENYKSCASTGGPSDSDVQKI
ncbi:hypothetical protein PIROE2DRAFT_16642 [Piromyces sp. E2]|nr:hypothetical protein PIROE2DRAFT_16642 [Piromyces sp. E2]|eukprot:OUM58163.1 hypothetical protein PIROE2DRAFT_16642 [Piromyces sp. E2]